MCPRLPIGIATGWLALLGGFGLSWGQLAITITDASVTLSPGQSDYEAGYVEAIDAAGIRVNVVTDSPTGLILYVRCDDGSPEIALSDLLVRYTGFGSLMPSYTAITGTDQALYSRPWPTAGRDVDMDVRIQGLWGYPDAAGGGGTDYTNTVTFTVVDQ